MKYFQTGYEGYMSDLIHFGGSTNDDKAFAPFSSVTNGFDKFANIIFAPFIYLSYNIVAALVAPFLLLGSMLMLLTGDLQEAGNLFVGSILLILATLALPFITIASPFINLADCVGSAFNSCFEQGPEEMYPPQDDTVTRSYTASNQNGHAYGPLFKHQTAQGATVEYDSSYMIPPAQRYS